ncbi:MAG TPA: universal stress protein [Polyangiaceae bacterium]|jgi:nucleotide-binding universal stress UspA family protein|nr:universal stress protein [Polyangiaceae bacterium]
MAGLKRILVPTDFTETSDHALSWAIDLAKRLGASITVMHAYEIPIVSFPDGALLATPEIAGRLADASRTALDAAVRKHADAGVALDSVLREGAAWEEINAVADLIDADMVVIGTHGRRGFSRALLGSVAENVVRTGHRPIVTIRGKE